jgi:PPP family 3-phenylpropionic acid transporter
VRKFLSSGFYFVLFAGYACVSPFLVLYFQDLGFSGTQIGLLTGIIPLITMGSVPFWTRLADATRQHRLIMSVATVVGVVLMVLLPWAQTFAQMLAIGILFNLFMASVPSFADSATMFMLGNEKEMYGRIRVGGAIGFGLMAPIAGLLVENLGLKIAFWCAAALFFIGLLISQNFKFSAAKTGASERGSVRSLLESPFWILFLILAFAGGLAYTATSTYFFPYMDELGIPESIMGTAILVGMLSEIPIMFFGNRLIKRFGAYGLLLLAMVISGIRLVLFAVSGSALPILLIQLLNGLSFPAMWVAGVAFADHNAPENLKTTAQGLFGMMVFGFGSAVGGFGGGLMLDGIGGQGLFAAFGVVVLVITIIVGLVHKRVPIKEASESLEELG